MEDIYLGGRKKKGIGYREKYLQGQQQKNIKVKIILKLKKEII